MRDHLPVLPGGGLEVGVERLLVGARLVDGADLGVGGPQVVGCDLERLVGVGGTRGEEELDGAVLAEAVAVAREEKRICMAAAEVRGMRPRRCAMNSSLRTEELTSISTRSMATVGTSAIMTRRRALAMLASVSRSSNLA